MKNNNEKSATATGISEFAASKLFEHLFNEGMTLLKTTTQLLEKPEREPTLLHARHSMEILTRLMYISAWLFAWRAVRDGDMEADYALREFSMPSRPCPDADRSVLREAFCDLYADTDLFWRRICRLDLAIRSDNKNRTGAIRHQLEKLAQTNPQLPDL